MASLHLRPLLLRHQNPTSRLLRPYRQRLYSTTPTLSSATPSPLLLKLRTDLKTALKAKDTARLAVLRDLLGEITASSKPSATPITTDIQILSLLRKRATLANAAREEFRAAGREDLVEREEGQARVLEEYAGSVETMSKGEVREVVVKAVEQLGGGRGNVGEVMKTLLGPGGMLEGKPVEKKEVAAMVKEVLAGP